MSTGLPQGPFEGRNSQSGSLYHELGRFSYAQRAYVIALQNALDRKVTYDSIDQASADDVAFWYKLQRELAWGSAIENRRKGVAGIVGHVKPGGPAKADAFCASMVDYLISRIPHFMRTRYQLTAGFFRGSAWSAITGKREHVAIPGDDVLRNWWVPGECHDVDRQRMTLRREEPGTPREWYIHSFTAKQPVKLKHPEHFITHFYDKTEADLGLGRGINSSLSVYLTAKEAAMNLGLQGMRRWAMGLLKVAMDGNRRGSTDTTNDAIQDEYLKTMHSLFTEGVLVHDKNDEVDAIFGSMAGHEMAAWFIEYLDTAAFRMIQASDLTTGQGGSQTGSYALSQVQAESRDAYYRTDRASLGEDISLSLVRLTYSINRPLLAAAAKAQGLPLGVCPEYHIGESESQTPAEAASTITTVLGAEIPLRKDWVYEQIDAPQPEEGDEVFEGGQPGGGMEGMFGGGGGGGFGGGPPAGGDEPSEAPPEGLQFQAHRPLHYDASAGKLLVAYQDGSCRWITIGADKAGKDGEGGRKGFPVCIGEDGTIQKGRATGANVKNIGQHFKDKKAAEAQKGGEGQKGASAAPSPLWNSGENRAADPIVTATKDGKKHLLLIQRGDESWALPGGFVDDNAEGSEAALEAARREAAEETGIDIDALEGREVGYFNEPGRDPRDGTREDGTDAFVSSRAFAFDVGDVGDEDLPRVEGADDALNAQWVPVDEVGALDLYSDHADIIDQAQLGKSEMERRLERQGEDARRANEQPTLMPDPVSGMGSSMGSSEVVSPNERLKLAQDPSFTPSWWPGQEGGQALQDLDGDQLEVFGSHALALGGPAAQGVAAAFNSADPRSSKLARDMSLARGAQIAEMSQAAGGFTGDAKALSATIQGHAKALLDSSARAVEQSGQAISWAAKRGAKSIGAAVNEAASYISGLGADGFAALMKATPDLASGLLRMSVFAVGVPVIAATLGLASGAIGAGIGSSIVAGHAAAMGAPIATQIAASTGGAALGFTAGASPFAAAAWYNGKQRNSLGPQDGQGLHDLMSLVVDPSGVRKIRSGIGTIGSSFKDARAKRAADGEQMQAAQYVACEVGHNPARDGCIADDGTEGAGSQGAESLSMDDARQIAAQREAELDGEEDPDGLEQLAGYSPDIQAGLWEYTTSGGDRVVNEKLRSADGEDGLDAEGDFDEVAIFDAVDRATSQKLREPVRTFRGMQFKDESELVGFMSEFTPGAVIESKGFQSSSRDPRVALEFASEKGRTHKGPGVLMSIKANTGAIINSLDALGEFPDEDELLLGHGVKYRVVASGAMTGTDGVDHVLHLEEI